MDSYKEHYSVMKDDILALLENNDQSYNIADLTFGAGGHSLAFLNKYTKSTLYTCDQDPDAVKNSKEILSNFEQRVHFKKTNFHNFAKWMKKDHPQVKLDLIVMDLGVSSHHFDSPERGFSFKYEGPLDMRMDIDSEGITAKEIINEFPEEDIANIIFEYGEERLSRRIAKRIIEVRKEKEISSTKDLEDIVFHCYPKNKRFSKAHPATKTFQALRIFVNRELEVLEKTLPNLLDIMNNGGKLAVISFHSLEDRIVKHTFKKMYQDNKELVKIITKKPLLPSAKELSENNRSRSAKLRILEKTTEG
jgi:16S rRNA (cytosine1402-N4)-methyltransferase